MRGKIKDINWKTCLTLFAAGALIIIFYFLVRNLEGIQSAINTLNGILRPFFIGFVMAYLICPIYNGVVKRCYSGFSKLGKTENHHSAFAWAKVAGIIVSLCVIFLVIGGFLAIMIPRIIDSIVAIVDVLPGRMNDFQIWITDFLTEHGQTEIVATINNFIDNAEAYVLEFIQNVFSKSGSDILTSVTSGLINTVSLIFDVVLGFIACIYFLLGKERFIAAIKRFTEAHFKPATRDEIYFFGEYANKVFGGFISGKIIDSVIIGILCYVVTTILGIPYAILVSTIVGITNIVPFFGPFIGAVPSAIIICVQSPLAALEFLILIVLLQQFDGNILGPYILGGRVGVGSFWVMFSIILGGGLFGFAGMLFAVPVFAIISYYFDRHNHTLLVRKGKPSTTEDYTTYAVYGIEDKTSIEKPVKKHTIFFDQMEHDTESISAEEPAEEQEKQKEN